VDWYIENSTGAYFFALDNIVKEEFENNPITSLLTVDVPIYALIKKKS